MCTDYRDIYIGLSADISYVGGLSGGEEAQSEFFRGVGQDYKERTMKKPQLAKTFT